MPKYKISKHFFRKNYEKHLQKYRKLCIIVLSDFFREYFAAAEYPKRVKMKG